MKKSEEFAIISESYHTLTQQEQNDRLRKSMYDTLLSELKSFALIGVRVVRIYKEDYIKWGLHIDSVREEMLRRLVEDGFKLSDGKISVLRLRLLPYTEISW